MTQEILSKLYADDLYLTYLRYHPKWYVILNEHPEAYSDFEKEVKVNLKLTTYDKIDNIRKQVDFINGIMKYLNSSN